MSTVKINVVFTIRVEFLANVELYVCMLRKCNIAYVLVKRLLSTVVGDNCAVGGRVYLCIGVYMQKCST